MIDKLKLTLHQAADGLKLLDGNFCIIGASAIILSDIDIGITHDIDILTTSSNADTLKKVWKDRMEYNPILKESELFKSNFARFNFEELDIEVLGDLQVYKNNNWVPLKIEKYESIPYYDLNIRIPSLSEQIRILTFFGREKEMKRINLIQKHIHSFSKKNI